MNWKRSIFVSITINLILTKWHKRNFRGELWSTIHLIFMRDMYNNRLLISDPRFQTIWPNSTGLLQKV